MLPGVANLNNLKWYAGNQDSYPVLHKFYFHFLIILGILQSFIPP